MADILRALCISVATVALLAGCQRAEVGRAERDEVQPAMVVREPPVYVKPPKSAETSWIDELRLQVDVPPAGPGPRAALVAERGQPVAKATAVLLETVRAAVEIRRKNSDKWSIVELSCGKARRSNELVFSAEVGLTKLYAKRRSITFTRVPLELCVAQLARESGISQTEVRSYNPIMTWQQNNVSAFEAIEALAASRDFDVKYTDAHFQVWLEPEKFKTQAQFVEAAVEAILQRGRVLNTGRPVVLATPRARAK